MSMTWPPYVPIPQENSVANAQSQNGPKPESAGNDIADYAQLFAAVLTVVGLLVSASGVTDLFRNLATVLIAIAICNIVVYLYRHRVHLGTRRIWIRAVANAVIVVVLSVVTFVALPKPGSIASASSLPSGGNATDRGQPIEEPASAPTPILDKKSYPLRRSSSIDTNDQDKVDLDTACPGWGGMSIRVGPRRCGELADLIVDEEGLHTPEGQPQLVRSPPERAGYETCRVMLGQRINDRASILETKDIKPGGTLCVETDKRNIAMVRIDQVGLDTSGDLENVTINFTVWTP
jgi:hypothetical protein